MSQKKEERRDGRKKGGRKERNEGRKKEKRRKGRKKKGRKTRKWPDCQYFVSVISVEA
jgi:hypothetical protein